MLLYNEDDNIDDADIDNGDDNDKKFVDERGNFDAEGEQNDRRLSATDVPSHGDTFFVFDVFADNLPMTDFLRGRVFGFDDMIEI